MRKQKDRFPLKRGRSGPVITKWAITRVPVPDAVPESDDARLRNP